VKWSWERIVRQLMPALALLALFSNVDLWWESRAKVE
jgi:hypothetical protein